MSATLILKQVNILFGTAAISVPMYIAINPSGYSFVELLLYAKSFLCKMI